jgi:hypothetical protein
MGLALIVVNTGLFWFFAGSFFLAPAALMAIIAISANVKIFFI